MNFQFAINIVNTDIISRSQLSFICTTDDVDNVVKMFLNNLCICILVCLTIVTSKLHTIIMSCYLMFVAVFIVVEDTSDTINTVFTINASFTFFNSNISSCIFTIFTSRTSQTNVTYAIFTGDRYCIFTVFTRNTNFTIDTICTRKARSTCSTLRSNNSYAIFTCLTIFTINNYFIQVS